MSGNITINANTTVAELHAEVYNNNLNDYIAIYDQLLVDFPQFQQLIESAELFTSTFALQQEGFVVYINEEIIRLYEDIAQNSFPANVDLNEVKTIFRELGEKIQ